MLTAEETKAKLQQSFEDFYQFHKEDVDKILNAINYRIHIAIDYKQYRTDANLEGLSGEMQQYIIYHLRQLGFIVTSHMPFIHISWGE